VCNFNRPKRPFFSAQHRVTMPLVSELSEVLGDCSEVYIVIKKWLLYYKAFLFYTEARSRVKRLTQRLTNKDEERLEL
jgi:hypothetical protein